jgi:hypothetical protein
MVEYYPEGHDEAMDEFLQQAFALLYETKPAERLREDIQRTSTKIDERPVPGIGNGVFATESLRKGTRVAACEGVFVTDTGLSTSLDLDVYIDGLDKPNKQGKRLRQPKISGYVVLKRDSLFYAFNHKCVKNSANCKYHREYVIVNTPEGLTHKLALVYVVTTRNVPAGAQLTVNYNTPQEVLQVLPTVACCCRGLDAAGNAVCPLNSRVFNDKDAMHVAACNAFWAAADEASVEEESENESDGEKSDAPPPRKSAQQALSPEF